MKTIVTHMSLDLDAATSTWLIKRFLPGWSNADICFVSAGSTLDNKQPDINKEVIHVDTGLGMFDHHQTSDYTSATKLVFEYLSKNDFLNQKAIIPLERMVNFVNDVDHFAEAYFPDATSDIYDFTLYQIIEGLKSIVPDQYRLIEIIFELLDAELQIMKNKVSAEEELKKGLVFQSKWGKSIALKTRNEEAVKLALKTGFALVLKKDPEKGNVRIKTLPEKKYDLTSLHEKILQEDKKGTWFLHISKNMLLNSSSKNPNFIPTSISLQRLIEIVKEI